MVNEIVSGGQLINYELINEKNKGNMVLLFLHGWRSQKEVWGKVAQLVNESASQQLSVCLIDLPGFGKSRLPKKPFSVGDYAGVVAEFIKKLELKNVILVGHSFGGRVGIKLAATYPQLINKLVLVDSAGFGLSGNKKIFMTSAAKIAKPFFKPRFMQNLRSRIYKTIGAEDYLVTPELQKTFVNITSEDLSEDMKKVKASTLIIYGEKDLDTPVEFGQRMNSLISNSQFVILKSAGHFSFLDKPEEFVKEVNKFI